MMILLVAAEESLVEQEDSYATERDFFCWEMNVNTLVDNALMQSPNETVAMQE